MSVGSRPEACSASFFPIYRITKNLTAEIYFDRKEMMMVRFVDKSGSWKLLYR